MVMKKTIYLLLICQILASQFILGQTQSSFGGLINVYSTDSVVIDSTLNTHYIDNRDSINAGGILRTTSTYTDYLINNSDTIPFQDVQYVTDPPHCYMAFWDSSYVLDNTQNEWIIVSDTGRADSLFIKQDFDQISYSGDTIINTTFIAHYQCDGKVTIEGGMNEKWQLRITTSDDGVIFDTEHKISVANAYINLLFTGVHWEAEANAKVWIEIRNITDSDDATIHSGNIRVIYTHNDN